MMLVVIGFIVFVERGQRRIPVSYAKRVVGRKVYGGQSTHLPLRVNTGGVIPIIFAASIITIPATHRPDDQGARLAERSPGSSSWACPSTTSLYVTAIIFFTYFYVSIIFNPTDVADNLRKYGGFIPGIRAGQEHLGLHRRRSCRGSPSSARSTWPPLAILPEFLMTGFKVQCLPFIGTWLDLNLPKFVHPGPAGQLLLRRHLHPDRRRGGHGHHAAGRGPARHAPLRRVHAPRPGQGAARMRIVLFGAPGSGKGTQGEILGPRYRAAPDLHRRPSPPGRQERDAARPPGRGGS